MRLTLKFALLMLIPIASMVVSGVLCYFQLRELASHHVDQQAMLLMRMMNSVRRYTQDDALVAIKKFAKTHSPGDRVPTIHEDKESAFIPELVPSYAARKVLSYMSDNESEPNKPLKIDMSQYIYKESSLSPTRELDKAKDKHELEIIDALTRDPRAIIDSDRTPGAFPDPIGRKYLARAMTIDGASRDKCLACHGRKEDAPIEMRNLYDGGFDWGDKLTSWNGVVAAQIVYVPKQRAEELASQAIQKVALWLLLSAVVTIGLLWWGVNVLVIRPVRRLSDRAEEISMNRLSSRLIPVRGTDEMAQLTGAFNRMITSLYKLIQRRSRDGSAGSDG